MGLFKIFKHTPVASKTSDSTTEAKHSGYKEPKGGVFRSNPKDDLSGSIKTIPYTSVAAQSPRGPIPYSSGNRSASSSFVPDPARAAYRNTAGAFTSVTPNPKAHLDASIERSRNHLEAKQRELRVPNASFQPRPNIPTSLISATRRPGLDTDAGQRRSLFGLRGFSSKSESGASRGSEHDFGGNSDLPHTPVDDRERLGQLRSSISLADVASAGNNAPPRRSHLRHDSGASLPAAFNSTVIPLIEPEDPDKSEGKLIAEDLPVSSLRPSLNTVDNRNSSTSLFRRDLRQDSFEVRSFRHVSGSGVGSDAAGKDSPAARSPQTVPLSELQPPTRTDLARESRSVSMPRLSRPPSFAGSIGGEEPARQVSVQMFKQTRRLSTSSVFTLEAYQYADADIDDTQSIDKATRTVSPERLRRTSTRGSAVEMLSSPPRKTLETPENSNRSRRQASATSTERQCQSGKLGIESEQEPFAPLLEIMADDRDANACALNSTGRQLPRPGTNQRRAFSVVGSVTEGQAEPYRTLATSGYSRPQHPANSHGRSQSTTSLPAIAAMPHEPHEARGRTPLSQRLTNVATITPASVTPPDIAGCLIPPVGAVKSGQADAASPVSPTSRGKREISTPRISSRTTSRSGWDSTSSEDEDTPKVSRARQKPPIGQGQPRANPAVAGRSLPSGLRRPPAPSEAFGATKWHEPLGKIPDRQAAATSSPPRSAVPSPKVRRSLVHSPASETESDSISSSSSDESLAVIKRKQSKSSLASKLSYSTPSLASPVQASSASGPRNRSPLQPKSSSRMSPKRRMEPRALPAPPDFVMAGLSTSITSSWPYESPASSQSGTTGENSSRMGPVTPQDASPLVRPMFLNDTPKRSEASLTDVRPRSVSFNQPTLREQISPTTMQRNTRRKAEIQAGIELGRLINGDGDGKTLPAANGPVQMNPSTSFSNLQDPHRAQYEQMMQIQTSMQMQMHMQMQMQQMQAAQMMPGYFNMHQQAMAAAKQQYQAAMAAAAIQAADEAWERASNAGGPGSYPHASADDSFSGGSLSGFAAATPSLYGGSVYDSHIRANTSQRNRYASSASVYGDSFGPPSHTQQPNTRAPPSARPETNLQYDRLSHRRNQSGSSFTSPLAAQTIAPPSSWKIPPVPRTNHENRNDPTNP